MINATDIIDMLGEDAICKTIGVKPPAVYKARRANQLPALWYAALCEMAGEDLPREVFSFKGVAVQGSNEGVS